MKNVIISCFISAVLVLSIIGIVNFVYAQNSFDGSNVIEKKPFNIAVASDWGCNEDAKETSQNIQASDPELVISAGDLSYKGAGDCWSNEILPFKSKLKTAVGDHDYDDTLGGKSGLISEYLKPLDIHNTYYSIDFKKVHLLFIDPYINYGPKSDQYRFIESDLKNAFNNPQIEWTFVVEHIPIYTSQSKHPANLSVRDTFHPLFDKYGVDLVFSGDNHNYQRTFPLKYNVNGVHSNPLVSNKSTNDYNNDDGVIYIITGTAGRSHYGITSQSSFVANQDDKHFGFLNIQIKDHSLEGTFLANHGSNYKNVQINNNINSIDHFKISKNNNDSTGKYDNF